MVVMLSTKPRTTFTGAGALALVLVASACTVEVTDFGKTGSSSATTDDTTTLSSNSNGSNSNGSTSNGSTSNGSTSNGSTSNGSTSNDGTTNDPTTLDTTTLTTTTNGTATDTTGNTSVASTTGGLQNPQCNMPVDIYPALPPVNTNEVGDPAFADWEKLDCESLEVTLCNSDADCQIGEESGWCMLGMDGGQGVCTELDVDVWCDGEGEAMNYEGFGCYMCSPLALRAKACCEDLPGFDCRTWPYETDGPINSVCAVHEDCESGLICGQSIGTGYGICQCPEGGLESNCIDKG